VAYAPQVRLALVAPGQLGDFGGDPPGLVAGEQLCGGAASGRRRGNSTPDQAATNPPWIGNRRTDRADELRYFDRESVRFAG
jgi:hypothetical protein